jgi:hypothetical protein
MKSLALLFGLSLAAALPGAPLGPLPPLEATCLSGRQAKLPAESLGKAALLIFGFSKASKENTMPWEKEADADYGSNSRCAVYVLADLSGAPGFIRGFIKSAMRSDCSASLQDRFLILTKDSALWKKSVAYDAAGPDDAYLLLLDSSGQISFVQHGRFKKEDYPALKARFDALIPAKTP